MALTNLAYPGYTTKDVYLKVKNDNLINANSDLFSIMLGTNDLRVKTNIGNVWITDSQDRTLNYDINTIAGSFNSLIKYIREINKKAIIILLIPPISTYGYSNEPHFEKLIDLYYKIGDANSCPVLNISTNVGFNSHSEIGALYYDRITSDGDYSHPNDLGHKKIASILEAFLLNYVLWIN